MTILSNGHQWKYSEFIDNKDYSFDKNKILKSISKNDIDDAYDIISKWEGYSPTPLLSLNKLSNELNLKNIFYKDENKRFDLKSFKALGGAYAVEKVSKGNKDIVVATATAGGMPIKNRSGVIKKPPPTPNIPERIPTSPPKPSKRKAFTETSAIGR